MKQARKVLPFLLAAIMLLSSLPLAVSAETVTANASAINTSRGEGQLIIYTSEYGAMTATNEWGSEAVVGADNKVTEVGGNNSAIPTGGFVLSGHDSDANSSKMKTWINQNVEVGDYVYYNERTLVVTVSDEPLTIRDEVFYEISTPYNGINTTRGENHLVVYTASQGKTTGTNEYGYEVTVENGLVTTLGGNNSPIPSGSSSFVVSGHGTAIEWLQSNVVLGMRAVLNQANKTVTFIYDAQGLEKGLTLALDNISTMLETAKENFMYIQYDVIESELAKAKRALHDAVKAHSNGGTDEAFADACKTVSNTADTLRSLISESYTVQYRAVWIRPSQSNAAEVEAYVKTLHDLGINTVCVEGNFNNGVIMNTPDGCLFERIKSFNYDVLQAYIDACHKYGMECHLWMAIMEVGHSKGSNYTSNIAYKKPEWLSLSQNGTPDNPDDFMMIDPANEEARAYLVDFYEWIIRNYDIDCFEMDYIRYYTAGELDFGYTQAAFEDFEEIYHHGVTPTYNTSASYWNDWVQYRKDCVTAMVQAIREMIDRVNPDVLLSADVVATVSGAGNYNYQDFPTWLENDWLDILHPMAYGDGYGKDITEQVKLGGDTCMVVTGLGVFMDSLGATEMVRQSVEDNTYGAYGDCFFEASTYLKDKAGEALLETVYRNSAISPFSDTDAAIRETLNYMQSRINDVLIPLGGVTNDEAATLAQVISAASDAVADYRIPAAELQALRDAIDTVADEKAKTALQADLFRTEKITCVMYGVDRDKLVNELELPEGDPNDEPPTFSSSDESESSEAESKTESVTESAMESAESTSSVSQDAGEKSTGTVIIVICAIVILAAVVIIVLVLRKK